eukprot:393815_1
MELSEENLPFCTPIYQWISLVFSFSVHIFYHVVLSSLHSITCGAWWQWNPWQQSHQQHALTAYQVYCALLGRLSFIQYLFAYLEFKQRILSIHVLACVVMES